MFQVDSYYDLDNNENDDEDEAEELPAYLWVISDEYCSSSMLCYGNGLKERRWNQVLRAKERNLKVKNLKKFMIDMFTIYECC